MHCILIAEDEPRIAAFIEKGLRRSGFSTIVVSDGNVAIEAVFNNDVDLLLLDLGLPGKDGQEVLRELRKQNITLPIIVITARSLDQQDGEVFSLATDVVSKPLVTRDLVQKVKLLLS
ncbi:MAG: response regulator [Cyanobacteria bacterium P01_F01_bin.86]